MSGETARQESGWTVDTLKEYFEQRFEDSEKAILKAETASERRFESVNEFRAQLSDQTRTFLPRETFESVLEQWTGWRQQVDARLNQTQGQGQGEDRTIGYGLTAFGLLLTVISIVLVVGDVLTK